MKNTADVPKHLGENDFDDAGLEFEGMSVDALGLDTIVYFPYMRVDK